MLIIRFYDSIVLLRVLNSNCIKTIEKSLDNDYSKLFFDICRNRV